MIRRLKQWRRQRRKRIAREEQETLDRVYRNTSLNRPPR